MIDGYRIVPFIPAGRRITMEILLANLRRFGKVIDEVQIWLNTGPGQDDDLAWLYSLPGIYGDWVRLIPRRTDRTPDPSKQRNTGGFYIHTTDPGTIYFRFDDDIVYIHPDYFTSMTQFRIAHPGYFLVFGHIWHNAIISYLDQQVHHNIGTEAGVVSEPFCMDPVGWRSGEFAEHIHRLLLQRIADGTVHDLFWDGHELPPGHQFSVSNFCFFGADFAAFGGELDDKEEETWLTCDYPQTIDRINAICGSGLVSHFSFYPHRDHMLGTGILGEYRDVANRMLEAKYYDLLQEESG